jgi:OFA family oxalate/formate antiporter-like MFS transporter
VSNLSARLLVGAVSDRVSLRLGIILSYACVGLSVVMFLLASSKPLLFLAGVVVGLGYGGSILMMPVLTGALFGTRSLGKILGLVLLASGVGSMTGTFLVGRIYDATKSYQAAFILLLVFTVASVVAIWPVRPRRQHAAAPRPAPRGGALNLALEKKE